VYYFQQVDPPERRKKKERENGGGDIRGGRGRWVVRVEGEGKEKKKKKRRKKKTRFYIGGGEGVRVWGTSIVGGGTYEGHVSPDSTDGLTHHGGISP